MTTDGSGLRGKTRRIVFDNDGAAAVMVAVVLLLLFGAALLSIDAGSVWLSRRELVTGTDAAALATAAYFVSQPLSACNPSGVTTTQALAEQLLATNGTGLHLQSYEVDPQSCSTSSGSVSIEADSDAQLVFAPIFGINDVDTEARSTAQWGPLVSIDRLRPIALCRTHPAVVEWASLGNTSIYSSHDGVNHSGTSHHDHPGNSVYPGAGVVHRIALARDSYCDGDGRGNVGWIDFNGSSSPNGSSAIRQWLNDGFDRAITLQDCDPTHTGNNDCEGESQAPSSFGSTLSDLECSRTTPTELCPMFPMVIYDSADRHRDETDYEQVGFLGVILRGWDELWREEDDDDRDRDDDDDDDRDRSHRDSDGSGNEYDSNAYLDLEFVRLAWDGNIGSATPSVAVYGVQLCGVDLDASSKCDV